MHRRRRYAPAVEPLEGRAVPSGVVSPQVAFMHPEAMATVPGHPSFIIGAGALPTVPVVYLAVFDSGPADVMVSEPTWYGPLTKPHALYPPNWTPQDIATMEAVDWYLHYGPSDPFHSPAPPLPWRCTSADPFGLRPTAPTVSQVTPCAVVPIDPIP